MQIVAEMWLVLKLTGSELAVGLTAALQFLPMLFVGAWGGLLADRLPKRRLLMRHPDADGDPGPDLWVLTGPGSVRAWMVLRARLRPRRRQRRSTTRLGRASSWRWSAATAW